MSVSKEPNKPNKSEAAFLTWNKNSKDEMPLADYQPIQRASAGRERFKDLETNISVRDGFNRTDYEYFRPDESVPKEQKAAVSACMEAYKKVGLIKNVIDLMSDFGCQGVKLVHPNPRIQKFYRGWFKKVNGRHVSERFLNMLYRAGNVIVKRSTVKINVKNQKEYQTIGSPLGPDMDSEEELKLLKKVIPGKYNFLSPLSIEIIGGELAQFAGSPSYAIKIPANLRRQILHPKSETERQLISKLPAEIVAAAKGGKDAVPLDSDKLRVFHYKKDDWQAWSYPMIYAILDDVILLEKMKLADLAALDGAISQVRLWRLGSLEHEIFPTDAAVQKLADILMSNPGGGAFDLIWGPELDFKESGTNVHQFLGSTKYDPVWNSIYAGLGVPPTLTGAATASGFTNNYISLKTLVQRLEYGRDILRSFWEKEISILQKSMGFRLPASIQFDRMVLSDESAEKALLIQLADRGLISSETLQERFGEIPEIERIRSRREDKAREKGSMSHKAGPWHNPEKNHDLSKIAMQRGIVTPSEVGLELDERKEGESTPQEDMKEALKQKVAVPEKKTGVPQQGRPKNSKDSEKRSQRTPKPKADAEIEDFIGVSLWAKAAQSQISDIISPAMLEHFGKKNLRSLSAKETETLEAFKFSILCSLDPYSQIDKDTILDLAQSGELSVPSGSSELYKKLVGKFVSSHGSSPSVDDLRDIQVCVYSVVKK
tara:strand:- start:16498 stop:18642 length:2145 start_codon:yes stop_codon:yes gene_type:complete